MSIIIPLLIILIAEFVGDFLLQSREMALNKSKEIKVLLMHLYYIASSLIISFGLASIWFAIPFIATFKFVILYCLIHGIQDWFIWNGYKLLVHLRIVKKTEKELKEKHNGMLPSYTAALIQQRLENFVENKEHAEDKAFYDTIGLDRLLHVATIIILYGVFFL
jgi:hypothetical protein